MFIVMVILFWVFELSSILTNVQVHLFVIKMINEKNTKKNCQFKYELSIV